MKNRIIFSLGLLSISFLLAFQFCSVNNTFQFKSYDGLLFYDLEEKEYYLEDIESGTDIILVFKNDESEKLDLKGIAHVEVHGLYNKSKNSLRVLSLFETSNSYSIVD